MLSLKYYHSHCYTNSIRVVYPPKEAEAGIEEIVVITLKIDKFGNIIQTIVKKSLTQACDNECLKPLISLKNTGYLQ